jgi:hypothetical protein
MAVDLPTKVEDPAPDGDTIEAALDRTPYKTPLAESDMDDLIAQFGKLAITVTQKVTIPWPPMDQPVDYSDAPVYVAPYKTPLAEIDVFTSLFAQLAIKDNAHEMSRFLAKHRHLNEALTEAYLKCPDLRDNYLAVMGTIVGSTGLIVAADIDVVYDSARLFQKSALRNSDEEVYQVCNTILRCYSKCPPFLVSLQRFPIHTLLSLSSFFHSAASIHPLAPTRTHKSLKSLLPDTSTAWYQSGRASGGETEAIFAFNACAWHSPFVDCDVATSKIHP